MSAKPTSAARKGTFDAEQLAALLPASLGEWKLTKMGRPLPPPVPQPMPALQAEYATGAQTAVVALMTNMPIAPTSGERSIHHERREDRQLNVATLPLSNGLTIIASSHAAEAPALAKLINSIDLARAEKLVRSTK